MQKKSEKKINDLENKRILFGAILRIAPVFRIKILESESPVARKANAPIPDCNQHQHTDKPNMTAMNGPSSEHNRRQHTPIRIVNRHIFIYQTKNPHKRRTRRVGLTPSELQAVATLLTPGGLPRGGAHHPGQRQTIGPGHATRHPSPTTLLTFSQVKS